LAAERGARPRPIRPVPDPVDPEVLLEREKRQRTPAAIAAAVAGVLSFAGFILLQTAAKNRPTDDRGKLLDYHDHAAQILAGSVLIAVSALGAGYALLYLYNATKGRRPQTISAARITAIVGPVVLAASQIGLQIVLLPKASSYASDWPEGGKAAAAAAKDILDGGALQVFATLALAGQLALGFAFVIISLNAMRAGLLTRFVGILGILLGVLMVVPLLPSPIVMSFWLVAVAALIAGRSPTGVPPAWASGKEQPWPSQQEMRERVRAEKLAAKGEAPEPEEEPTPEPEPEDGDSAPAKPALQKRKRKRRR
jgi:hypothetical protein